MILIGQLDSPFVRRVAMTLAIYDIPFERRGLSIFRNQDEVRAITPLGKVPALQLDDGETLYDSHAIIDEIDARATPAACLTPAGGIERRHVLHTASIPLGLAEKSIAASSMYRQASGNMDEGWHARCLSQIETALTWLAARSDAAWFHGDAMTQADVAFTCAWGHVTARNPEVDAPGQFPGLAARAEAAEALAAFRAHPFQED